MKDVEHEKRLAAEAAAELVTDGMRVGLGTGSTVAYLLEALARRAPRAEYVATSPRTRDAALAQGLAVKEFDRVDRLDLAIDGADQVAASGWLVKGGGGAHTREKIVAAAADRFIVIADSSKLVDELHGPVPLELSTFGLESMLRRLTSVVVRQGGLSPDGGVIADYQCGVVDPWVLAPALSATPGIIAHGLFDPELVGAVFIGVGDEVLRTMKGAVI